MRSNIGDNKLSALKIVPDSCRRNGNTKIPNVIQLVLGVVKNK